MLIFIKKTRIKKTLMLDNVKENFAFGAENVLRFLLFENALFF
jgi:hypothetical protein